MSAQSYYRPLSDLSPLACFCFATTFLACGICNTRAFITGDLYFYPAMLFVAGLGQLLPGIVDMLKNETFGGVALCAFGIFWITEGLWQFPYPARAEAAAALDADDLSKVMGFYRLGWFITVAMFAVAAWKISKVHGILITSIDACVLVLTAVSFVPTKDQEIGMKIFGYCQIVVAFIAYYTGMGVFFKAMRVADIPMGWTPKPAESNYNPSESAAYRRNRLSGDPAFP